MIIPSWILWFAGGFIGGFALCAVAAYILIRWSTEIFNEVLKGIWR
jgi:hypothetical protein